MSQSTQKKLPDFVLKMHQLCAPYGDVMSAFEAISEMEQTLENFYKQEKEIIKQARLELDYNLDDVAKFYNLNRKQLAQLESPHHRFPNKEYVELWAAYSLIHATKQIKNFDYKMLNPSAIKSPSNRSQKTS